LAVFDLAESMNAPSTNKCIFSAFQDRSLDLIVLPSQFANHVQTDETTGSWTKCQDFLWPCLKFRI